MKDMFYNYDYHINEKLSLPKEPNFFSPDEILTADPNISIIQDAKGKEIGVKVKHGMPFTLYFYLDDYSTAVMASQNKELYDLITNSDVLFEVISTKHNVIISLQQPANEIFDTNTSQLCLHVNQEQAQLLAKDSYRLRVLLSYPGGYYELYSENDGLLIVR